MTACHYTPSQIDEMEMLDVLDLFKYWSDWPPAHEVLFIANGGKPPKKAEKAKPVDPDDPSGIGGLIQMFPNGFV
jgi:hypothetical protein